MQLLTCADQHPPLPGTLSEHTSILFMLNCYDVWSVSPPSKEAEAEADDDTESPDDRSPSHA